MVSRIEFCLIFTTTTGEHPSPRVDFTEGFCRGVIFEINCRVKSLRQNYAKFSSEVGSFFFLDNIFRPAGK